VYSFYHHLRVAEKGKAFEERILASADGKSSKFNFMRPQDPYYAYYELKIREFEEGVAQVGIHNQALFFHGMVVRLVTDIII